MTRAVRLWQKDYRTNQGIMVEISEVDTNHQIHPVAVGLASNRDETSSREVRESYICPSIYSEKNPNKRVDVVSGIHGGLLQECGRHGEEAIPIQSEARDDGRGRRFRRVRGQR